jgi:HEAT repeat protein
VPDLKDLLDDLTSADDQRAGSAVLRLAEMDAAVRPELTALARSADADHRWWAICALAESPHTRASDLLPFTNDPSPDIRQAALLGLCSHADEAAVPALIQALDDPDPLAAGLASRALVRVGPEAVPSLIQAVEGSGLPVRVLALRALSALRDHRAIPAMLRALEADSALLQHWASQGLERLGLDMVYTKP